MGRTILIKAAHRFGVATPRLERVWLRQSYSVCARIIHVSTALYGKHNIIAEMERSFTLLMVTFYCYIVLYVALFSIDIYGSSQPLGTCPWKRRSRWLPLQIELARPTVANANNFNRSFTYFNEFSVSAEVLSKAIVVRRAYFDNRKRYSHQNAIVFMLEMKRSLRSSLVFTGCRVGSVASSNVHFRHSKQYDWAIKTFHVTTSVGYVDCYDINATIKDGDEAYLKLKTMSHSKNGSLEEKGMEIKSQRNVVVPHSRKLNVNHIIHL